jgi:hypothetical protein
MRGIISQKGPFSKNARPHGKILKKGPDKISNKVIYRVYKKKRNLGISQEIEVVLKTKDFRRLGI